MTNGALSFDFSKVTISDGPDISVLPVNTPMPAVIEGVSSEQFNGVEKFIITQQIYYGGADESKVMQFKSFIGPNHGWLLAQYLEAVGEDFRSLSGHAITANALESVLSGHTVYVSLQENTYTARNGVQRTSKQINRVRKFDLATDNKSAGAG